MIDCRFVPVDVWPGKANTVVCAEAVPARAAHAKTLAASGGGTCETSGEGYSDSGVS